MVEGFIFLISQTTGGRFFFFRCKNEAKHPRRLVAGRERQPAGLAQEIPQALSAGAEVHGAAGRKRHARFLGVDRECSRCLRDPVGFFGGVPSAFLDGVEGAGEVEGIRGYFFVAGLI